MSTRTQRLALCAFFVTTAAAAMASAAAPSAPADGTTNDPEIERRSFKVADGFEVTLFAAEPMLLKPVAMNFDPAGRLWVSGSETYPQLRPGDVPNDKVFVLEDADGDGKADKSTLFADGLFIPTGIVPGDGGAYVANSTELLHLKDTDNDGKADQRRVLLAGFGTEDTHHIIHTFRWGPDGRMYFEQAIYIHSQVETPFGIKKLDAGGVWRCRPETQELDILFTGLVNGWGYAWNRWGQTFATDGAGGEGINFVIPGCAFTASSEKSRVLKGLNPKSPKYCGLEVLSGRHMPDDVQGDLITGDFRANRVVRYKLSDDGAGFEARLQPDFITSTDKAFRPIDMKMGPDGALYIADWYNPIINHGEVDFRDPRRDKKHGRIWRVTAKGRPPVSRPHMTAATAEELLGHLTAPEDYARQQARVAMRELGAEKVVPALAKWVKGIDKLAKSNPAVDADHARLEALWAYECVNTPEPALLKQVLQSKNPAARAAAARVASHWAGQLENVVDLLAPLVADEHPRVRMEAVRALAAVKRPEAVTVAMRALDKQDAAKPDPFVEYAIHKTAWDLQDVWLPALREGKLTTWADPKHLNYALQAVKSPDALKTIAQQLREGKVPADARKDVYDLFAAVGSEQDLAMLLSHGVEGAGLSPAERAAAIRAVERGARQRKARPVSIPTAKVAGLFESADPELASAAMRLAGVLRLDARGPLEKAAGAAATPPAVRTAAVEALADMEPADAAKPGPSATFFGKLAGPGSPPAVRAAGTAGLALLDPKAAAASAGEWLAAAKAEDDVAPVIAAFLKKEGGADALATALKGKKLSPDVAKLSLRYVQGVGISAPGLTDVLRQAAGLTGETKPLSPDEMKQMVADVAAKGDPARGEIVFRNAAGACYQCHAVGGAGGALAPDLRSIGAASPVDYIIDSILQPTKAIKDGFDSLLVSTKDGDVIQGIKVREDDKELVLRDNLRDEITIALSNIKSRKDGGSLMPAGLTDGLTRSEFLDLVRFLSELGKPGPYAVADQAVVRRWRVLDPVPANLAGTEPKPPAAGDAGWVPAYSLADGTLRPNVTGKPGVGPEYVRCQIEVTAPGKVRLVLNSAKGLVLWVGDQKADIAGQELTLDLPRGVHTLTFRIDRAARGPEGLRVSVAEAPGSPGRGQPLGGR